MQAADDTRETLQTLVASHDGNGGLRSERRRLSMPGPGEILLQLRCCGFCGTDLFKLDNQTVPAGTVLGHELVGTIAAMGSDVHDFSMGQRIVVPHHVACGTCGLCRRGSRTLCPTFKENLMTPGGFADLVLIGRRAVEQAARAVPDAISDASATFLEPAACVLRGIDKASIADPKGCAVVIGGGSMGLLHLLVLRAAMPALAVVVVEPIAERRRLAMTLGAAAACAPAGSQETISDVTGGFGADAAFDTVGGSKVLEGALSALRPGGTAVLFAHAAEGEAAGFELNPLFKNERRVVATYSGSLDEQERVADWLFQGRLDPTSIVTHSVPLNRAHEAVELARNREALKVMITASETP